MKKSRFTEQQIFKILKEGESGQRVSDVCRAQGISEPTYYKWKAKYGGMEPSMMKRLRDLEAENNRLKKMYADAKMDNEILKEVLEKKF